MSGVPLFPWLRLCLEVDVIETGSARAASPRLVRSWLADRDWRIWGFSMAGVGKDVNVVNKNYEMLRG